MTISTPTWTMPDPIKTALVVILLSLAATAGAQQPAPAAPSSEVQEKEPPAIDASPDSLLRLLAEVEPPPERPRRVEVSFGAIDIRAFGTRWRIGYLPFSAPFVGSRFVSTKEYPDAFSVLGVTPPMTPRAWRDNRALNSELRRIENLSRSKSKVNATIEVKTQ